MYIVGIPVVLQYMYLENVHSHGCIVVDLGFVR